MADPDTRPSPLSEVTSISVATAIERFIADAPDYRLNRINPLTFAKENGLAESESIAGFLHATQLGMFDLAWNVVCGGCGGVLHTGETLRTVTKSSYYCALCTTDCAPVLDDAIEVTFTVAQQIRPIAAHSPETLALWDYARQIYWSSGADLPGEMGPILIDASLGAIELAAGSRAVLALDLSEGLVIVFDPVTHSSTFIEIGGPSSEKPQAMSLTISEARVQQTPLKLQPGRVDLTLENRTASRVLPILWRVGDALADLVGRRRSVLTAKRLLSHQTFREIYRTEVLNIDQRFQITNLTFVFTDLKGSTQLYERIGDLAAFDLVRAHFQALTEIIADGAGAVVKTIGDSVMATFSTPAAGLSAALRMQQTMKALNRSSGHQDMLIKIGLHAGPCLAVVLNHRQDYFGQTVNIASRVESMASVDAILATSAVMQASGVQQIIDDAGLLVVHFQSHVRGVDEQVPVYEISMAGGITRLQGT